MTFVLDTSAIIGMAERHNVRVADALRSGDHTELPICHPVSLGELASGVHTARLRGDESALAVREQTLTIARSLRATRDPLGQAEVDCFGVIAALTSRRLSHNDQWILACTAAEQAQLITEDERQATATATAELQRALMDRLGLVLHPALFVGS